MRFSSLFFPLLVLAPLFTQGQSSSSSSSSSSTFTTASPSSSSSPSGSHSASSISKVDLITTTITSVLSASASAQTTSYVLTLTLNTTTVSPTVSPNSTLSNNNATLVNGTTNSANSTTNGTVAWNSTDQWLPFTIPLDPAFGVAGALLIVTGLPVAALGGKNRWSSLAISAGYSLSFMTLVLILSFGVEPALQPPSPDPPTAAMRGLYLLATAIACLVGAGLGIFFFNVAKHWVGAVGGFSFGWFLLATKSGGLITSIVGRWCLLGGLTVGALLASITPITNEFTVLLSTAWVGATVFTLGVDCYSRAGLKEFYIYNLGYRELFPALNGQNFPLTQTMEVELGVIAAVALIGGAVQFRVVNVLQRRLKQMREEEEARIEAEQVAAAAEQFKNLDAELGEWEEKHGKGVNGTTSDAGSTSGRSNAHALPTLTLRGLEQPGSSSSGHTTTPIPPAGNEGYKGVLLESSTLPGPASTSLFEEMNLNDHSSTALKPASPTTPSDPELESQMRLLAEVQRARQEIRSSMDQLRSAAGTPSPSLGALSDRDGRPLSNASSRLLDLMERTPTERRFSGSSTGLLDTQRRLSTSSSRLLEMMDNSKHHHSSTTNTASPLLGTPTLTQHRGSSAPDLENPVPQVQPQPSQSEWETYLQNRQIVKASPPVLGSTSSPTTQIVASQSVANAIDRRGKTTSVVEPRVSDFGPHPTSNVQGHTVPSSRPVSYTAYCTSDEPISTDSATKSRSGDIRYQAPRLPSLNNTATPATKSSRPAPVPRTMTYDQLADRHRRRLSLMQEPLTLAMRHQVDVATARDRWETQKKAEREAMKKKEREREELALESKVGNKEWDMRERQKAKSLMGEKLKTTDQWRRSVVGIDQLPNRQSSGSSGPPRQVAQQQPGGGRDRMAPPASTKLTDPRDRRRSRQSFAS